MSHNIRIMTVEKKHTPHTRRNLAHIRNSHTQKDQGKRNRIPYTQHIATSSNAILGTTEKR